MTRLNLVSVFCLLFTALLLSSCGGGAPGDYSTQTWNSGKPAPAQSAPNELSSPYETADASLGAPISSEELPAAGPAASSERDTLQPVKVGLLLPLSGQHRALGEAMLNAAQIALFDVGHNSFELLPQDTQGTQAGGRAAAQAVIQSGAELVLGPVFADAVRGAKPIAQRARVNMIAFSTDWQLAGGGTYIMGFLPFDQVDRITSYAASRNISSVGVFTPASEYGQVVTSAYQAAAARYGLQTAALEKFPPQTTNLSPALRNFTRYDARKQASGAQPGAVPSATNAPLPFDAVLMPVGGEQALSIANLLSYYDMPPTKVRRLGTGLLDNDKLANEPGLNGAWFAAPSPRLRQSFEKRYRETYGAAPPRLSSLSYDATALAAILARRGLKTNGQPAFDQSSISNPNGFAGIDGIFRFRPDGTAQRGLAVLEFKNGNIVEIDAAPKTFQQGTAY